MSLTAVEQPGRKTKTTPDMRETGTRTFVIVSTTRLTGWETVTGLPAIGDAWPSRDTLLCQEVSASEGEQLTSGGWAWTVECEYRNWIDDDSDASSIGTAPLDRSAVWTWDSELFEETRFADRDGNSYTNSVGDMLATPPVFDIAHVIATVKKNYSSFDGSLALSYVNCVNHAYYAGGARGTVKIDRISAEPKVHGGIGYYAATIVLHYNPDGWVPYKALDAGPRYRKLVGGTWKIAYNDDSNGVASTEPVLLLEDGTRCSPGLFDFGTGTYQEPHFIEFRQYDYANFAALNLT